QLTPQPAIYPLSLHDALPILLDEPRERLIADELVGLGVEHVNAIAERILVRQEVHLPLLQPEAEQLDIGVDLSVVVRKREHGLLDRKSTRLNSSHVKISYAVF